MPRVHVVQVIPRPSGVGQVPLVASELHALRVLVVGGRFFSEGVVDVVGNFFSACAGDQARRSQVVEVEVALAGLGFGSEEEAVAVDVVGSQAPAAVVQVLAQDLASQVSDGPAGGILGNVVGPDPFVVGGVEVDPVLGS